MAGLLIILMLAIAMASCSSEGSLSIADQQSSSSFFGDGTITSNAQMQDMVNLASKNAQVTLGTNLATARVKDQPQMNVAFSYDFSIGRHEVTCGEYNSVIDLMNADGRKMARLDCENDSLPANNVTYYDAVLYANARSRLGWLDTAYEYKKIILDADGHCTGLDGFVFHPERAAFRLPTEAEWVFAAQSAWDPSKGWTADNSDYKLHNVCTAGDAIQENGSTSLCDMAGNVMEWANDWLGSLQDTTIVNYAGAPDGGGLGERVLKGGGFRNAASSIFLYSRGDVYTVTSSTRAEYVGFRLAFGAIPNAKFIGKKDKSGSSQITLVAETNELEHLVGTSALKLVFRNDLTGNLAFIDYFDRSLTSVVEILDTIDSYHPEISPNGKKVAFCTRPEGVGGKSELYVRNLSASGRDLVKLNVESAAIPRWRVTPEGDTMIVYVSDAGNNKNDAEFLAYSTWQVPFSNGQFGTPSKLYDGNYHGGLSDDGLLAVTGSQLLRAHVVGEETSVDTVWYNGEQACNVSLAKDGSKRTIFLDFGGKTGRAFAGTRYRSHEQILVADSLGNLVHMLPAPAGYSFDHSEWASLKNSEYAPAGLAVASLVNFDGAHEKLVLVNIADGQVTELVQGDELWHPHLWIKPASSGNEPPSLLALDSAGVYLLPFYSEEAAIYRVKMEMFWKNVGTSDVLVYGSSRVELGVEPDVCPDWNMLNLGVMGIDVNREIYFLKNYGLNHSENLKAIAMSLDFDYWRPFEGILDKIIAYPGYVYDRNHDFWKDGIPSAFLERVEYSYAPSAEIRERYSSRGAGLLASGSWDKDGVEVLQDSMVTEERMAYINKAMDDIFFLADECAQRKIHFIGIIFPQAPQYSKTGSFGLYGIQRSVAKKIIERFDSLAVANPYFHLMDENKMGKHDYSDVEASNRDHLSAFGAAKFSSRLDSLLKTLDYSKAL